MVLKDKCYLWVGNLTYTFLPCLQGIYTSNWGDSLISEPQTILSGMNTWFALINLIDPEGILFFWWASALVPLTE